MRWSREKMEAMAADGDERAKQFLAALDAPKKSPAMQLMRAVANVDTEKVVRQERRNLNEIKRRLMLMRGEACQVCAIEMPTKSLIHAHHIVPIVNYGTDDDSNIVLLCPNCHAIAHWRYRSIGIPQTALAFFAMMAEEQSKVIEAA